MLAPSSWSMTAAYLDTRPLVRLVSVFPISMHIWLVGRTWRDFAAAKTSFWKKFEWKLSFSVTLQGLGILGIFVFVFSFYCQLLIACQDLSPDASVGPVTHGACSLAIQVFRTPCALACVCRSHHSDKKTPTPPPLLRVGSQRRDLMWKFWIRENLSSRQAARSTAEASRVL